MSWDPSVYHIDAPLPEPVISIAHHLCNIETSICMLDGQAPYSCNLVELLGHSSEAYCFYKIFYPNFDDAQIFFHIRKDITGLGFYWPQCHSALKKGYSEVTLHGMATTIV